jgi:2Fe-2S ferredoxin
MDIVKVEVLDSSFKSEIHEFPTDVNLSLMEALKASGYPIEATCGGMALCATCQVEILEGMDQLPEPKEAELDMLDTLPILLDGSRLACQIRVNDSINGIKLRIIG